MTRRIRRAERRRRGQAFLRRTLLFLTALVVLAGLASHLTGRDRLRMETVAAPTATPVTAAFDETLSSREVTLPAETWYAIQTGVYSTEEAALERLNAYADRGAPGYAAQDGGKWRVFIACYGEKSDAANVRERLLTLQQVETYVHAWTCPEIMLRLTGMNGQLDVAEAGLALPLQAARLLRDEAIALDAGERSAEGVQESIRALGERISLWADTARQRFPVPYPALIQQILSLAEGWRERDQALTAAEDATALSAEMKRQAMDLFAWTQAMRASLAGNQ